MRARISPRGLLLGVIVTGLWVAVGAAQPAMAPLPCPSPVRVVSVQLLNAQEATTDGQWVNVRCIQPMGLSITGIIDATVEIDGTNARTQPANNAHGLILNAQPITSDQFVQIDLSLEWLKVRVPAYTDGSIDVWLVGYLGSP